MELNKLRDIVFSWATEKGFHDGKQDILSQKLMLVVSELSKALEADRNDRRASTYVHVSKLPYTLGEGVAKVEDGYPQFIGLKGLPADWITNLYESEIKGSVEEEIADAVIRLADIAGMIGMDLDWHIEAKMTYNKSRSFKHGKKY